ncbi:hypothetical protein EAS64_01610 [Trebonia kvetii]|uniref:Uncharacterized protein n=1 Tax=Trebonia kvetii TaxID=2480626 RepID=A0A6P2C742_9ACTN|nr:hypothetical protein [Trebonia kvetii]TVZ06166.1 hypothetical protein EAS64_01610 [Trebonia kvetii]
MTSPAQTRLPGAPLRPSGWATRRTPLWVFAALAVLAVGVLLVSLSHKPSDSQRAADLTGYFRDAQAGIGSCAAGLRDSENAYRQVLGGDTGHEKTAESVFTYGGSNCTVAGNQALTDFASYQVTESLSSLNLDAADNDLITWSFEATAVQQDMLAVVRATGAARASAQTTLASGLAKLDAERAAIDAIWTAAKRATGATSAFPSLPA